MGQPEISDSAVSTSVCFSVIFSMMISARVRLGAGQGHWGGQGGLAGDRGRIGGRMGLTPDRAGSGSVQGGGPAPLQPPPHLSGGFLFMNISMAFSSSGSTSTSPP